MSDHIRGNDQMEGDNTYPEFFDETMRWFDHYVRGVSIADAPVDKDPANEIETNDRSWRAESAWPPADSTDYAVPLTTGSYTDDTLNNGSAENTNPGTDEGEGIWTISPPMTADQRFSGVPMAHLDVTATVPSANLAANVYDIDPAGKAIMLSRSTYLLAAGEQKLDFEMYGNDWLILAGHRIGLLVSSSNSEWWNYVPTGTPVTVNPGSTITVPFLRYTRTATIPGKDPTRLKAWLDAAPFTIPAATITAATSPGFPMPPAPTAATASSPVNDTGTVTTTPAYANSPGAVPPTRRRLTAHVTVRRLKHHRRRITVYGTAPAKAHLTIGLRRGHKRIARRRLTTTVTAYRVTFVVHKRGRYRIRVAARVGHTHLKAISRKPRVR